MEFSPHIARRSPIKILCLEDNDPDYELVEEYLDLAHGAPDYELQRAENLTTATKMLREALGGVPFDIVLSDLTLPDSRGEATFLALQEVAPDVAITVLTVLTGLEDDDLGLKLVKEGAQDYLPKDQLNPMFLLRSVLHAIERKRNQVEVVRLNAELKSAQLQLIQAEKLESLGRLSAGVAHEIKNPLAILQGCVDFYNIRASDAETEDEILIRDTMQEAISRATKIVSGMLDFSRDSKLELRSASLNQLIDYAVNLVDPDLRRAQIGIVLESDTALPPVDLDTTKIEQVLVNLLINAMHASSAGGKIVIRSYAGTIDHLLHDDGLRSYEHLHRGDEVVIAEVRDFGSGIPEDKIGKIFDPFFTTKATGKGTGLGLSVSRTIVDLHGGLLRIKNVDPPGVCAQVILRSSPGQNRVAAVSR